MDKYEKEELDKLREQKETYKKALLIAQPYVMEALKNQVRPSRIAAVTKDLQQVQDALMCDYEFVGAFVVPVPCPACDGKGILAYCDLCGGTGEKPPSREDFRYMEGLGKKPEGEGFVLNLDLSDHTIADMLKEKGYITVIEALQHTPPKEDKGTL